MKRKLSVAIKKGVEMAKKLGIKRGRCALRKVDANGECEMCALGMALLPVLGKDQILNTDETTLYEIIDKTFYKAEETSKCLKDNNPVYYTFYHNDAGIKPLEIAEKLKSCGF